MPKRILSTCLAVMLTLFAGIVSSPPVDAAGSSLGADIIASGMQYLGAPYQFGASVDQTKTFDCSSFTYRAFMDQGVTLPRTSVLQSQLGKSVKLSEAAVGDLVFFRYDQPGVVGHVGVYMGDMKMLSATTSKGVRVVDISTTYWMDRYLFAKQVLPSTYTVVSGDGLWKIAYAHGVTIDQLKQWNRLGSNLIYVGQRLFVSNPNLIEQAKLATVPYRVVSGDTLWKISVKTGATIAEIRETNRLTSDYLYVGQLLQIPN